MQRNRTIIFAILLLTVPVVGQWKPLQPDRKADMPAVRLQANLFPERKSVLIAIAGSLVLPGLGEYYAGNFATVGKYYLTAEGAIWVSYAAFRRHGSWVDNDGRAFAAEHAGVSFDGKDDKFGVDIGNYGSLEQYNQAKMRLRQPNFVYTDPSYNWHWDSDANRAHFKDQRIRRDQINNNSKFLVAAAVINRVISAFSAGRAAAAYNRSLRPTFGWNVDLVPQRDVSGYEGLALQLSTSW